MSRKTFRTCLGAMAALALSIPAVARAQDAVGTWHGALVLPTGDVRIGVRLQKGGGGLEGVIYSPDQAGREIPVTEVKQAGGRLSFAYPPVRGRFEGDWDAAKQAWVGTWTNVNGAYPLTLATGDIPKGPVVTGLDGDWEGAIEAGGAKLRLVLHVKTGPYGTVATLDSPDQLANGLPITGLTQEAGKVSFIQAAARGVYAGTLSADGASIAGQWTQMQTLPLNFTRRAAPVVQLRPQTPKPPFPYREAEVAFDSAPGVRLAGTLTLPPGKGPFPAAVLITGSGAQNRDEALMGHRPFAVLADDLTRRGVAVLRYDDRGFAKSTGNFATATMTDFATDAASGVAFLRGRRDIDSKRVGVIGHSEGGLVGPMVAADDPKLAFVVMMAGPGAPLRDALAAQRAAIAPTMGASGPLIQKAQELSDHTMAAMAGARDEADAQARAEKVLLAEGAALGVTPANASTQARIFSSAWFRNIMAYDPGPTLAKVRAPILAINGSKDMQVIASQNLTAIRKATAGNPDVTVTELPGLNHLFQTARTGAPGEYADIEETIAPVALQTIGDWVVAHTKKR